MKKTRLDRQQDWMLALLRPLVHVWMRLDAKRVVHRDPSVDFKRKEPFVMLANHTFLFDVVHVPLRFRNVPFIIASQTLFARQPSKFFVTQMAHVIPKSKGRSDMQTIKMIFNAVKKGYPILIFPEGNTTFYGETEWIEEATMKLIKKLGLDVITCNVRGGYLSKPRWATGKRKNRRIELYYRLEITKEQLSEMSVDAIKTTINQALYHNDYQYQREKMIPHPGKQLAEGLEDAVYVCPHCEAINSIATQGNVIHCQNCHKEGYVDDYGFIQGFVFDNLIEWNQYQRRFIDRLRSTEIVSSGQLFYLNLDDDSQIEVGSIQIVYRNHHLHISGAIDEVIPIDLVKNTIITLRRDLEYLYDGRHFVIKMDRYAAAFLRILQDKY